MTIRDKIVESRLSDEINATVFRAGKGRQLYAVGGHIRDALLGRVSADRDYAVVGPPDDVAKRVARATGGRFVEIGRLGLFRVVLPDKRTLDFVALHSSILRDLRNRDFTINALAWTPTTGLIDNCGGRDDLGSKCIRMVSARNLKDDPVRVIRAYRFMGDLSFRIDPRTRSALREFARLIPRVKSERTTLEFLKLIDSPGAQQALSVMTRDGVLGHIISLSTNELVSRVKGLSKLSEVLQRIPVKYRFNIDSPISQGLTIKGLFILESILKEGDGHRLLLSGKIRRRLRLLAAADGVVTGRRMTTKALFKVLWITKDAAIDYLITHGMTSSISRGVLARFAFVVGGGMISTEEVIDMAGNLDRQEVGRLIMRVRESEFNGEFRNKDDVRRFVRDSAQM